MAFARLSERKYRLPAIYLCMVRLDSVRMLIENRGSGSAFILLQMLQCAGELRENIIKEAKEKKRANKDNELQ